ncbi:MAG: SIS domain-containing protein [Candidatus Dormibacterales bacterium]
MAAAMARQPHDLARLLADPGPAEKAAGRLLGRRVVLAGTGSSWHAAHHGALLLQEAGVPASAVQLAELVFHGPWPGEGEALLVLSHTGATQHAVTAVQEGRARGLDPVVVTGLGSPLPGLTTVEQERSSAYTSSHLAAMFRLAQVAVALGAGLRLEEVPEAVAAALATPREPVAPPRRLLELTGQGPNRWTAAEGALKVRETSRVATEGLSVEQLLHGPAVALGAEDALVCLDGGGPQASRDRLAEVAAAAAASGVRVHRMESLELGEALSVFPLTVAVQRLALDLATALGTDPDAFGRDVPGRAAWDAIRC